MATFDVKVLVKDKKNNLGIVHADELIIRIDDITITLGADNKQIKLFLHEKLQEGRPTLLKKLIELPRKNGEKTDG